MPEPQFSNFGDEVPQWDEGPTRLSLLAISSLVTGILSFIGCCLPALGLVPLALGVGSLVAIQRSMGRVAGRGLAIAGLILGLLSLIVSTGLWIGATSIGGQFGPVYAQGYSPDPSVVRSVLTSSSAAAVTDQQIAEFQAGLTEAHGDQVSIPGGLWPLYKAYSNLDPAALQSIPSNHGSGRTFPLPAQGSKGWFAALAAMTQGTERVGTWLPRLEDVGYMAPDGSVVWLLDSGGSGPPAGNQSAPPPPTDEVPDTPAPDPGA